MNHILSVSSSSTLLGLPQCLKVIQRRECSLNLGGGVSRLKEVCHHFETSHAVNSTRIAMTCPMFHNSNYAIVQRLKRRKRTQQVGRGRHPLECVRGSVRMRVCEVHSRHRRSALSVSVRLLINIPLLWV